MAEQIKNNKMDFTKWAEKIEEIYKDETSAAKILQHKGVSRYLQTIQTKDELKDKLDFSLDKPNEIAEASRTLFSLDSNYMKIISHYADMFHTRYTITPEVLDQAEIASEEYLAKYNEMISKVDGLNIEILIPEALREIFISGSVYIYAEANDSADTTPMRFLPQEFSRTVLSTNYGTNVIEFNFEYFDQFRDAEELEFILGTYPKEFTTLYNEYLTDGEEWKQLNPAFSTSILANEYGIPPFINALIGILEYEDTREVELEKAHRELQQILIHRIPVEDGQPIFDVDEVAAIQKAMAKITRNHRGLETITAFGPTELHRLQEEPNRENKRIGQAFKSIFNSAGLNASYFSEDTKEALLINRSIDKGMVWKFIKEINAFLNLTVNMLYDFGNMQVVIKILPITIHEEGDIVKLFRENASFGIGKLDAIVATGVKQKDLTHIARLEQELELDKLLTPLQSSHTQSGGDSGVTVDNTVEEKEIKNPEKEEEISKEEEVDNSEE